MPAILRRVPFYTHATHLAFAGRRLRIRSDQIVVWISLTPEAATAWHPQNSPFPALLDTGCNHNLVLRADQLMELAGVSPAMLPRFGRARVQGRSAVQLRANLWLHRNQPGQRDTFAGTPHPLETDQGILVIERSAGDDYPRLPLLGLRALRWANLHVHIHGRRRRVTVRTARRFGLFG